MMNTPTQKVLVTTTTSTSPSVQQLLNMAANKQAAAAAVAAASVRYNAPTAAGAAKSSATIKPPAPSSSSTTANLSAHDAVETFRTLSATLSSLNSYTISLQNQLNIAAAKSATSIAAAPTLAQAASVLSQANSLAQTISLYQHQQQQQQSLASLAATVSSATAAAPSSASASTCNLNNTLFVGNLHASLQEMDLIQVFRPFGRIVECCKKWLHFGFVKFMSEDEACHAYVTLNGFRLKGRPMRLEFQNRTKKSRIKAIIAQAALTNAQIGSTGPTPSPSSIDLLSMSSTNSSTAAFGGANHHNGLSTAFDQSSNINTYLQALTSLYTTAGGATPMPTSTSKSEPNLMMSLSHQPHAPHAPPPHHQSHSTHSESIAAMSFFNPDQLIKFATSGCVESDFGLAALADSSAAPVVATPFEFKLNDELVKDFHFSGFNDRGDSSGGDDLVSLLKRANVSSPNRASSSSPLNHDDSSSGSISSSNGSSGCNNSNGVPSSSSFLALNNLAESLSSLDDDYSPSSLLSSSSMSPPNCFLSVVSAAAVIKPSKKASNVDQIKQSSVDTCSSISEHMEFTCSSSSQTAESSQVKPESSASSSAAEDDNVSDNDDVDDDDENEVSSSTSSSSCNTSDDASELPTDTDCLLNEIDDLIDEETQSMLNSRRTNEATVASTESAAACQTNVADKNSPIGIYKCMNQTLSLFIEPNDVLKPMSSDEYNEYVLFPNRICDITMPSSSSQVYFI